MGRESDDLRKKRQKVVSTDSEKTTASHKAGTNEHKKGATEYCNKILDTDNLSYQITPQKKRESQYNAMKLVQPECPNSLRCNGDGSDKEYAEHEPLIKNKPLIKTNSSTENGGRMINNPLSLLSGASRLTDRSGSQDNIDHKRFEVCINSQSDDEQSDGGKPASETDSLEEERHATMQRLKDFISVLNGELEDGWEVEVQRRRGRLNKYYISPHKQKLRSRIEVAKFLGLWERREMQGERRGKYSIYQESGVRYSTILSSNGLAPLDIIGGNDVDYEKVTVESTDGCNGPTVSATNYSMVQKGGDSKLPAKIAVSREALVSIKARYQGKGSGHLKNKRLSGAGRMANKLDTGGIKEGQPSSISVNQRCQDVLRQIVSADNFGALCTLFQGAPTGFWDKGVPSKAPTITNGGLNFQLVAMRMAAGVYGETPELFLADMQQVWKNIQSVGNELIFLADSLSQVFVTLYKEQVLSLFPGGAKERRVHDGEPTSKRGVNRQGKQSKSQDGLGSPVHEAVDFCLQSSRQVKISRKPGARIQRLSSLRGPQVLIGAEERACKICGLMEGTDCLNCSSCKAGYHPYCLDPALSSLPESGWHCPACVVAPNDKGNPGLQPSYEERELSHSGAQDLLLIHEEHVDQTSGKISGGPLKITNNDCLCKVCGKDDDQVLLCDSCESAYHMHCLIPVLDRVPEENWYCPVCLEAGKKPFDSCSLLELHDAMHGDLLDEPLHHCAVCERIGGSELDLLESGFVEGDPISAGLEKTCKVCGLHKDGKCIISCDACAKAYHLYCLEPPLQKPPRTIWYCPSCLCRVCRIDTDDHMILLCDACDEGYHAYCLSPPLDKIPNGCWYCPSCSLQKAVVKAGSPKDARISLLCDNLEAAKGLDEKELRKRKRKSTELKRYR